MDRRSQDLLELPAVRLRLAGQASFAGGRLLAEALEPATDPHEVAALRAETEEAWRLEETTVSGPGGAQDVRGAVEAAARGAALPVEDLERILLTIGVALEVRTGVGSREDLAPSLAERLAVGVEPVSLQRVASALERALDRRGGLLDTATPELSDLRRRVSATRREAADTLRRLASRLTKHLQESFTTERSGRPVLAVKATSRSAVPGIVHDSSGSGQTIFVEPFEVVEANNRRREVEAMEAAEVQRILAELSRLVGEAEGRLTAAVDALAHHDLALARARLSRQWRGCVVEESAHVELLAARHPLLDPGTAVPIDVPLAGVRALVVSGPNTGGKTVALKTLGLFAMLAQCGLRVPARSARLPVFSQVLADIGDDQSIAQSLSTFSAHVRRLVGMLEAAAPGTLVLLDEVAGGTDPEEGGPLAQAVIRGLVRRGAMVLATTHLGALKEWAASTEGARNAAVAMDPETLRPRYAIHIGEPGASHALDIATGLGLDPEVIAEARAAMTPERRRADDLVRAAQEARAAAGRELEAARAERERAERARQEAEARLGDLEFRLQKARADAERQREEARAKAQAELTAASRELRELRRQISAARRAEGQRSRAPEGDRETARAGDRDRRLGAASDAERRARAALAASAPEVGGDVAVGDPVRDPSMGFRGVVVAIEGGHAEVQGERMRVRVPLERLVRDGRGRPAATPRPVAERRPEVRAVPAEVDVRGERAEAARAMVREAVDAAAMVGRGRIRVIHGHGTGALRAAVRQELERHPLVERAEPAPQNEGGDGATYAVIDAEADAAPAV
ncbi:MAG: Smr/MutS family protein [Thermoleophilia bacterium]|nr:Smr/MutS family protein [Thermoleophilia bacterium]